MDSDHRWYDVEFTIKGTLRVEAECKADAEQHAELILSLVDYNPAGYDNREMVGTPRAKVKSVTFVPQGYRQEDSGDESQWSCLT